MKKLIAYILSVLFVLSGFALPVFADDSGTVILDAGSGSGSAFDKDGRPIRGTVYNNGCMEGIVPDQTIYLKIMRAWLWDESESTDGKTVTDSNLLADDDMFRLKVKKDGDGRGLIDDVEQVSEKKDANGNRCGWLKITISPSDMTEEQKAELRFIFTAKDDNPEEGWSKGDYASVDLDLWINNPVEKGDDYDADPGEQFVYQPMSNESNELNWDDVAMLRFTADDDASEFYARLSTKADADVYRRYPDADLYFRNFAGNPNISTASRATLTLFNPWMQRDSQYVNPKNCHIYTKDSDGELSDVTSLFTYLQTDEEGNEVNGWQIKTRMLGSYVISKDELKLTESSQTEAFIQAEPVELTEPSDIEVTLPEELLESDSINNNKKPNPPTGRM